MNEFAVSEHKPSGRPINILAGNRDAEGRRVVVFGQEQADSELV
jgi:hypothetical protein